MKGVFHQFVGKGVGREFAHHIVEIFFIAQHFGIIDGTPRIRVDDRVFFCYNGFTIVIKCCLLANSRVVGVDGNSQQPVQIFREFFDECRNVFIIENGDCVAIDQLRVASVYIVAQEKRIFSPVLF